MGVVREGRKRLKWDEGLGMNIPLRDWLRRHSDSPSAECYRKKRGEAKEANVRREDTVARNARLGTLLAVGMDSRQAREVVGINPESSVALRHPVTVESVAAVREKLQSMPGFRLEDSANFYRGISEDSENDVRSRIAARSRIDKILGLEADKKVQIEEKRDLSIAIEALRGVGISPSEAVRLAVDAEVVEDSEFEEVD